MPGLRTLVTSWGSRQISNPSFFLFLFPFVFECTSSTSSVTAAIIIIIIITIIIIIATAWAVWFFHCTNKTDLLQAKVVMHVSTQPCATLSIAVSIWNLDSDLRSLQAVVCFRRLRVRFLLPAVQAMICSAPKCPKQTRATNCSLNPPRQRKEPADWLSG